MKSVLLLIALLFASESAIAQETAHQETILANLDEHVAAARTAGRSQRVADVPPANNFFIEPNALYAATKHMAGPDLHSEINRTGSSKNGVLDDWRERVFWKLGTSFGQRRQDAVRDDRLQSKNELNEGAGEGRAVTALVLRETLKFMQERVPKVDRLVKALQFEVSSTFFAERGRAGDAGQTAGERRAAGAHAVKDAVIVKTALRVPVEHGRIGLVSETEATYGNVSSYVNVGLDGRHDNGVGLRYVLGRDLELRVEQHANRPSGTNTAAGQGLSMVQVVYRF